MNTQLENAMKELNRIKNAGGQWVPSSSEVEGAKDGTQWSGSLANEGIVRKFTKNSATSYDLQTGKE